MLQHNYSRSRFTGWFSEQTLSRVTSACEDKPVLSQWIFEGIPKSESNRAVL